MSPIKIDLTQFDLILPSENRLNCLRINVNPSGYVSLSQNLRTKICWDKIVFFVHKKDDILLIKEHTDESKYFTIPKSNPIRAKELVQKLLELGVPLPAHYNMSWDDEVKIWIGVLEKTPSKAASGKTPKRKMPKLRDLI